MIDIIPGPVYRLTSTEHIPRPTTTPSATPSATPSYTSTGATYAGSSTPYNSGNSGTVASRPSIPSLSSTASAFASSASNATSAAFGALKDMARIDVKGLLDIPQELGGAPRSEVPTLLFFVGGITRAEIAAIRWLNDHGMKVKVPPRTRSHRSLLGPNQPPHFSLIICRAWKVRDCHNGYHYWHTVD